MAKKLFFNVDFIDHENDLKSYKKGDEAIDLSEKQMQFLTENNHLTEEATQVEATEEIVKIKGKK